MKYEPVQTDDFEEAKDIVSERIHETEDELERQTTVTERLEIARDTFGQFTKKELAEAIGVEYSVARNRVEFWLSTDKLTHLGVKDHPDAEGPSPEVFVLSRLL